MGRTENTEKTLSIGDVFMKAGVRLAVTSIRGTMVTVNRGGRISEQVPKMHLLTCSLYERVN